MSNPLALHGVNTLWLLHSAHNVNVISQKHSKISMKMGMFMKITLTWEKDAKVPDLACLSGLILLACGAEQDWALFWGQQGPNST